MKLLLDTHTFLWWDRYPEKLPSAVVAACEDLQNEICLSVASIWEIQIKQSLGKLNLHVPLDKLVADQVQQNGLVVLPVQMNHVIALSKLDNAHKDPFDRMLIAQANTEDMILLSGDGVFKYYQVKVLW
jgi:PIN domain nuclease of toxin-antitoxin system